MISFFANLLSAIISCGSFFKQKALQEEEERRNKEAAKALLVSHIQSYIEHMERGEHLLWNEALYQKDKPQIATYYSKEMLDFENIKSLYEQDCSCWLPMFPVSDYVSRLLHIRKQIQEHKP